MIKETLVFKIALVISTTIHIGGFGLLRKGVHPFFQNGYGNPRDNIIVFEIGWVEAKKIQTEEKGRRRLLHKSSRVFHTGSSGSARENLGGVDNEYLLAVRRCIETAKFYPREAKRRLIDGSATVGFYIDINGNPKDIAIVRSSGYTILDSAVKETILRAGPYPKPKDEKYVQTTIVFTFNPDNYKP